MYEFTGIVRSVGDVQAFASGFTKRELVVQEERDARWPNIVAFVFKKDNVAKLDGVTPGRRIKVSFAIDGREWTNPQTGDVRHFTDLTALRLDFLDPPDTTPDISDIEMPPSDFDDVEPPF